LRLGETFGHLGRQVGLAELAFERLRLTVGRIEGHQPCQLHRDRRRARHGSSGAGVLHDRARHGAGIHAAVFVERAVLGGDHGLLQRNGNRVEADPDPLTLRCDFGQQASMPIQNAGGLEEVVRFERPQPQAVNLESGLTRRGTLDAARQDHVEHEQDGQDSPKRSHG
jgi:hypothetical protein